MSKISGTAKSVVRSAAAKRARSKSAAKPARSRPPAASRKTSSVPAAVPGWAGQPRPSLPQTLTLKDLGSFYLNGRVVQSALPDAGSPDKPGRIIVDQMYVEYLIPRGAKLKPPVIMVHGSGHSGMTWLTTPDGREGWATWFARQGHPVYVVDHVGRARSGWDATRVNRARLEGNTELIPEPGFVRFTAESAFVRFRFGPAPDQWHPGSKFPRAGFNAYLAQLVPNSEIMLENPHETVNALLALLRSTGPAVLMVHSQSGFYGAMTAIAAPELVRALINVEGMASVTLSDEQVSGLVPVPMLVVAGDYGWRGAPLLRPVVESINRQGGNAYYLDAASHGMPGHSHMLMQDEGNLRLAAWISRWMAKNMKPAAVPTPPQPAPSLSKPLTLRDMGAFFVNARPVATAFARSPEPDGPGRLMVNQMYVEYLVPKVAKLKSPIVFVHGSNHTGQTYRTTPDGREGWATFFARKGHPVYIVDHVGRGRSGWDPSRINQARASGKAERIPATGFPRLSFEKAWGVVRCGPRPDEWWPELRLPREAVEQYMAQRTPNSDNGLPNARETVDALAVLLEKLGPSIVFVHSQSGSYGMQLAVTVPQLVRALVNVEGQCRSPAGPQTHGQMARCFGAVPFLHVVGGNIAGSAWEAGLAEGRELVECFRKQGRTAGLMHTDEMGLPGHSHFMMMDHGNLEIAARIGKWLDRNAA